MQINQFIHTVRWITSQYSEETTNLILLGGITDEIFESIRRENKEAELLIIRILKATNEVAIKRVQMALHPFAPRVLNAFGLTMLLDEDYPVSVAERSIAILNSPREKAGELYTEVNRSIALLARSWRQLVGCIAPLQSLLLPNEVAEEKSFDDLLTIELRYDEDINPQPSIIGGVLNNIEQLYAAVAVSMGEREYRPLTVIFISSGTSFRFDFKGLGEPIKQIKGLLVEAWNKVRHRRADDLHQNNQVLLSSLEVLRQIDADTKQNVLNNEEALRLREQVIRNTVELFEAGALPREVPNTESVSNEKLLHGIQVKLLPPAIAVQQAPDKPTDGTTIKKRRKTTKKGKGKEK